MHFNTGQCFIMQLVHRALAAMLGALAALSVMAILNRVRRNIFNEQKNVTSATNPMSNVFLMLVFTSNQ